MLNRLFDSNLVFAFVIIGIVACGLGLVYTSPQWTTYVDETIDPPPYSMIDPDHRVFYDHTIMHMGDE